MISVHSLKISPSELSSLHIALESSSCSPHIGITFLRTSLLPASTSTPQTPMSIGQCPETVMGSQTVGLVVDAIAVVHLS